jgi:hypothetical protein
MRLRVSVESRSSRWRGAVPQQELLTQTLVRLREHLTPQIQERDFPMKSFFKVAAVAMTAAVGSAAIPTDVSAATRSAYAMKKAECKDKAARMHFGVHLIKRNRWIKDCIAGAH